MARFEDPDSGSGEFFINLADNKHLDPQPDGQGYSAGFAVFGRVISGMSVLEAISSFPTQTQGGLKMLVQGVEFSASVSKSPH
jgi:peptidyl-prolyl cis-trans isomerase A (cyclophilin A)